MAGAGVGGEGSGGAVGESLTYSGLNQPNTFTFSVDRCTFVANQAMGGRGDSGGGTAAGGAVNVNSLVNVTVTSTDFQNNAAVGGSGGAGEPVPFEDNSTLAAFGGLNLAALSATLSGDSFETNTAQGG